VYNKIRDWTRASGDPTAHQAEFCYDLEHLRTLSDTWERVFGSAKNNGQGEHWREAYKTTLYNPKLLE